MKFLFDNNLPPLLAKGIGELSKHEPDVARVIHLTERFSGSEKDRIWIPALAAEGGSWYVVSLDAFKKDHRAEREAISRAGLTVYVLDPQWSSHAYWAKAAQLVLWWPHVLKHARLTSGGVHRVPWRHTSQSRFHAM